MVVKGGMDVTAAERKTEIMEAVERLLARGGAGAVTMRSVAAEADVSLRLVQYYGRTKEELLAATLDRHADRSVERWRARARQGSPLTTIETVRTFFDEALPVDDTRRAFHRVGVAMEAMALSAPAGSARPYEKQLGGLAVHLAHELQGGGLDPGAARIVAWEVMGLAHGVGTLVMTGQLSDDDARTLIGSYVDRLAATLES